MLTDWQYQQVQDFSQLESIWQVYSSETYYNDKYLDELDQALRNRLGLPITTLLSEESKFFKHHYSRAHTNFGTSVTEMQVIRKLEGW